MRADRARPAIALAAFAATLWIATAASGSGGSPPSTHLKLREIARFEQPTYVTQAPGEPHTLYVVEQQGRVIAVRKGHRLKRPFLDITTRVRFGPDESTSQEAGMYSIAFDPR
jgi:hypothetical protein